MGEVVRFPSADLRSWQRLEAQIRRMAAAYGLNATSCERLVAKARELHESLPTRTFDVHLDAPAACAPALEQLEREVIEPLRECVGALMGQFLGEWIAAELREQ